MNLNKIKCSSSICPNCFSELDLIESKLIGIVSSGINKTGEKYSDYVFILDPVTKDYHFVSPIIRSDKLDFQDLKFNPRPRFRIKRRLPYFKTIGNISTIFCQNCKYFKIITPISEIKFKLSNTVIKHSFLSAGNINFNGHLRFI